MTESGRRLRDEAARLRSHHTSRVLLAAAAAGVGAALGLLSLLLIVDRFAPLPGVVRAAGFAAVVLSPLVLFGVTLLRRLPALRDPEEAARRTESQVEDLREELVPALQVLKIRGDARTGYSTELVDAFVDRTAERVGRVRVEELPYNRGLRRGRRIAGAGAASAVLAVALLGPGPTGRGFLRLASAMAELGPRPPAVFLVEPGDVSVPRGSEVTLMARVEHVRLRRGAATAVLQWRETPESPWKELPLTGEDVSPRVGERRPVPVARFEHRFPAVQESFRYRFAHADELSEEYRVRAVPPPSLTIDEVRYRYPEYTGLPDRSVRDGSGDLAAVKGSTAEVVVRSTSEPTSARLVLESGPEQELLPDAEGRLHARVWITGEDSYRLHVEDALGLRNQNPLTYRVRALTDEVPFIRLLEPGEDRDLEESLRATLRFSAVDDYGLGPVRLVYEVGRREDEVATMEIHVPDGRRTEINGRYEWDLEPLDLLPGDTVLYHLEVEDNNAIDGPSTARTREYVLRFPTLGEIFARIDEEEETSVEELREVADEARHVKERIEEVSREILKRGESSWENRKEVERALESQDRLAQELQRVQEEIEANLDRLSESEFATLEAFQKMEQIQKLLDEVATEEMKEALEKLREALEQTNPRRMQEDLAQFQQSQEELMKQLDRVIENLKQFRFEERLKAAVRELEELAARQERVNDELSRADEGKREAEEGLESEEEGKGEAPEGDRDPGDETGDSDREKLAAGRDTEPKEGTDSPRDEGETGTGEDESSESGEPSGPEQEMERLSREEKGLAEEARRLEEELEELADMIRELRDSEDQETMQGLSEEMDSRDIPQTMEGMAEDMAQGDKSGAEEKGEKALTQLRRMLTSLSSGQQKMAMRLIAIDQAAINRAVRDLLSVSGDQEDLAADLAQIPRNSSSATRSFADEQYLLIQGAERVEEMLDEVAEDTPLMDSRVGKKLGEGLEAMREAAYGLENGAVHLARDDGDQAVEDINAVVIALLETVSTMSSCSSGMPMSGLMQQLQEMAGDQEKLNALMKQLMEEGGSSLDRRLQAQLRSLAEEQQRIQEQLQQLLDEGGGQGLLGRLDAVSESLDEVARKLREGRLDEEMIREQDWALTRLLDSQRSIRERDFGRERRSRTAEEPGEVLPPGALPPGLEGGKRDLREDLLKALERRYPPKYEDLIRRYFRSLTDEGPGPDLP